MKITDNRPVKGSRYNFEYFGPKGQFAADLFACAIFAFTLSQAAYFCVSSYGGVDVGLNTWFWMSTWLFLSVRYLILRLIQTCNPSAKDRHKKDLLEKFAGLFGKKIEVNKRLNEFKTLVLLPVSITFLHWSLVSLEATAFELQWINSGLKLPEVIGQKRALQKCQLPSVLLYVDPYDKALCNTLDRLMWEFKFSRLFGEYSEVLHGHCTIENIGEYSKLERLAGQAYKLASEERDGNRAVLSLMILAETQAQQGNLEGASKSIVAAEHALQELPIAETNYLDSISRFDDSVRTKLKNYYGDRIYAPTLLEKVKFLSSPFGSTDPTFLVPVLVPSIIVLLLALREAFAHILFVSKGRDYLRRRPDHVESIDEKFEILDARTTLALYDNQIDEANLLSHKMLAEAESYSIKHPAGSSTDIGVGMMLS